ncbi:unnamed protein product [Tenebrio molitor]|nr:unnamed protein product [Tenebrio molitor]
MKMKLQYLKEKQKQKKSSNSCTLRSLKDNVAGYGFADRHFTP